MSALLLAEVFGPAILALWILEYISKRSGFDNVLRIARLTVMLMFVGSLLVVLVVRLVSG